MAYDETVSTLACRQTPPRRVPVRSTLRNSCPLTLGDAVELRQPLIQERVVRVEEVENGAVLAQDVLEEQFRLLLHRHARVVGELRELDAVGHVRFEGPRLQPLPAEVLHQRTGPGVLEHPPHLGFQHLRLPQLPLVAQRGAARRPACCSTGSTTAASPVRAATELRRGLLDPEQEVRRDEHPLNRQAKPLLEGIAVLLHHRDQLDQLVDLLVGHRTPVGPPREVRHDLAGRSRRRAAPWPGSSPKTFLSDSGDGPFACL